MSAPSVSNTTTLYCPTCGKRIHPQSHFCRHCGANAESARPLRDADDFILPEQATNNTAGAGQQATAEVHSSTTAQQAASAQTLNAAPVIEARLATGAPLLGAARGGGQAPAHLATDDPIAAEQQLFQTAHQRAEDDEDDQPTEPTIWQGRPAWRAFAGSWCAWLAVSAGILALTFMYNDGGGPLVQAVWLFIGGSAAGLFARTALFVYGSRYRLTTERLFIHRGILLRITDQIELIRVDDVRIRQNILDRLLNTGTLDVFSSDETDETIQLFKISTPATVAEHVRNNARAVRQQHAVAVERI